MPIFASTTGSLLVWERAVEELAQALEASERCVHPEAFYDTQAHAFRCGTCSAVLPIAEDW